MPFKLYKRGDNFWYSGTIDGKRYRESSGTPDRRLAQDIATKREWQLRRAAVHGAEAVLTFGEAVTLYLDARKKGDFLLPLFDRWQGTKVADITPGIIRQAAREIYPKAKPATWNRQVVTPARAVINHCADLSLCPPIRVKRFPEAKTIKRAVDRSWHDALIEVAPPHLSALLLFQYQTAARISEAVNLRWADVSLQEATAIFGRTKNGDPHVAHLTPEMVAVLANLGRQPSGKVFGYASRYSVYGSLRRACKKAGIPYLATHQPGRHSFATKLIVQHGIDPKTVAEAGNWKSVHLLLGDYVHGASSKAVINDAFGTPLSRPSDKRLKRNGD